MDIYYEKDGALYNSDGNKVPFKKDVLADQIKDKRVSIKPYKGSDVEAAKIAAAKESELKAAKTEIISQIQELEAQCIRPLLKLTKGEKKEERDLLNARIDKIEALRAKL